MTKTKKKTYKENKDYNEFETENEHISKSECYSSFLVILKIKNLQHEAKLKPVNCKTETLGPT